MEVMSKDYSSQQKKIVIPEVKLWKVSATREPIQGPVCSHLAGSLTRTCRSEGPINQILQEKKIKD